MESKFQAQDNFWPALMHLQRAVKILESKELTEQEKLQLVSMKAFIQMQDRS